jgi:hypothetical protein
MHNFLRIIGWLFAAIADRATNMAHRCGRRTYWSDAASELETLYGNSLDMLQETLSEQAYLCWTCGCESVCR